MRDRIPGAPGQYTAVVTSAELQKLQNAEQFTITLMRDDQPLVEGTPYSKAAVLPDEVATKLCPNLEEPTPADAFNAIVQHIENRNNPHKVTAAQVGALPVDGGTMKGAINMGSKKITNLATPTANTDAANKKYVDDGLSNKQDAMELLWTNESTTSSFAAQTISLDLSGYDFVEVRLRVHTGGSSYVYALMRVRTESVSNPVYSIVNFDAPAYLVLCSRSISPYSSGVKFDDAITKNTSNASAGVADNARLVPVEIYGIKGVKM